MTYVLFDNESNKSTGGQNSYQGHVDYISIARGSNFEAPFSIIKIYPILKMLSNIVKLKGLHFLHVKCGYDAETPRPPIKAIRLNKV